MLTPQSPAKLREQAINLRRKAKTYRRWAEVLYIANEFDLADAIGAEAESFARKSRSDYHAAHQAAHEHTTEAA